MNYIICSIYVIFSLLGLTFMKLGSTNESLTSYIIPIINMKITVLSFMGYLFYICSFCLYTFLITKFDLSVIIPVLGGIVNILIIVIAYIVFHEKIPVKSLIGIALIIIGIFIMNSK